MTDIYVDGDACPVKDEIYKVARRVGVDVTLVANTRLHAPDEPWLHVVVVDDGFDAADDWITEHASENDIVVTGDIPLAARCLEKGARVLGLRGRPFTENNIGTALANREFLSQMRELGGTGGGPSAFTARDRSQFLQALDAMLHAALRGST